MRHAWLPVALLLSLGINLGLLAAVVAGRWSAPAEPAAEVAAEPAPPLARGGDLELPGAAGEPIDLPAPERPDGDAAQAEPAGAGMHETVHGAGHEPGHETVREPGHDMVREPEGEPGRETGRATGPDSGQGAGPGVLVGRLADHLGLEGDGRARFVELQRELVATHLETRRERRRLGAELHAELVAPAPDRARLEEITAEIGRLHTAGERRSAALILDSRALLDADQQRIYLGFLERLHGGRGHPGGHPGPDRFQRHRPRR